MDKAFSPRNRSAHLRSLGELRVFRAERPRPALLDRHPAPQRHRHAAHGARVPGHDHGCAHPLSAHERLRHAVAAGHGSCRHRHPDGGRAPAERGRPQPPRSGPRGLRRARLGMEGSNPAAPSHNRCAGSAHRSTGRRDSFTMDPGLSRAVTEVFVRLYARGPHLSRQAPGELGSGAEDRAVGPRGGRRGGERSFCGTCAIRSPMAAASRGRDHPPGDDAGRCCRGRASRR